eukprot:XP_001709770.1 Hypothetical protein GL50803_33590 [Giardia lamblia ATCC 50803]
MVVPYSSKSDTFVYVPSVISLMGADVELTAVAMMPAFLEESVM